MYHDPDLPDFDSMSQDELIQWLETLARRQSDEAVETEGEDDSALADLSPDLLNDDEWQAWIEADEDLQQETPPIRAPQLQAVQDLDEDDDETPTSLPVIDEAGSDDTTDPLTELDDLMILDDQPAADARHSQDAAEDPLEWLESLASEASETALEDAGAVVDETGGFNDIDDAWEDDERLEDVDDQSLYAQGLREGAAFLESLEGVAADGDDEYSTQSMAPVPDELLPEREAEGEFEDAIADLGILAEARPVVPHDNLMQAFLLQDHQADLEAWYEARLREIAGGSDTAVRSPEQAGHDLSALAAPPPGLAAGFNSARGKLADGRLSEALSDYETLLRANIGLDLVVGDMRWLLSRAEYRSNASVHRVLGDALMRQGHLQDALDVYRYALKLL